MTKSTSQSLCTYLVLQFYTCPNMSSLQTNFSLSHECNLNEKFFSGKVPDRRIPSHFCLKQSFDSKQSNAKVRYLYYYLICEARFIWSILTRFQQVFIVLPTCIIRSFIAYSLLRVLSIVCTKTMFPFSSQYFSTTCKQLPTICVINKNTIIFSTYF